MKKSEEKTGSAILVPGCARVTAVVRHDWSARIAVCISVYRHGAKYELMNGRVRRSASMSRKLPVAAERFTTKTGIAWAP